MSKVQTDNSYFEEKVKLRLDSIEIIEKHEVIVLEAFAGDGKIWEEVKKKSNKKIKILKIDKKGDKKGVYLKGDNLKFLKKLDFSIFDVVDFDAYGSPYKQLEILFNSDYSGVVHCTYIQTGMGRIDNGLLYAAGYSKEMVKKCSTMLCKDPIRKMENYLYSKGIKEITGYFFNRKSYFYFCK